MNEILKKYIDYQKNAKMIGWDFSSFEGIYEAQDLPWDYVSFVKSYLKPKDILLDMETGGGEILLTLNHPYDKTYALEGYNPNYELCIKKLKPLGIHVTYGTGESKLPFEDQFFDVITNRHGSYDFNEIYRCLKPNGLFITQQVGDKNNQSLAKRLNPNQNLGKPFNLASEKSNALKRFDLRYENEFHAVSKYFDIKAVIGMATIIEWEFLDFKVDNRFEKLVELEKEIHEQGCIESMEHRFILILSKK